MRRTFSGVVAAALGVAATIPAVLVAGSAPAQAAAYRYWTYWHVSDDTSWSFSRVGATGYRPKDGQVEGWRFAVSPGTSTAPAPRLSAATAFDQVCGDTPAQDGRKRVALVVDFGVAADAPAGDAPPSQSIHGSCVSVPSTANGMDVMAAADYSMRIDDSMVCGISGYPRKGCGDVVAEPDPAPAATSGGSGSKGGSGSPAGGSRSTSGDGSTDDGSSRGSGSTGSRDEAGGGPGTAASGSAAAAAAGTSASPSASGSASASGGAVPSADPLATGSPLPSLVQGAPAADTSGSSDTPWTALIGVALVASLAGAAAFQVRRRRGA